MPDIGRKEVKKMSYTSKNTETEYVAGLYQRGTVESKIIKDKDPAVVILGVLMDIYDKLRDLEDKR